MMFVRKDGSTSCHLQLLHDLSTRPSLLIFLTTGLSFGSLADGRRLRQRWRRRSTWWFRCYMRHLTKMSRYSSQPMVESLREKSTSSTGWISVLTTFVTSCARTTLPFLWTIVSCWMIPKTYHVVAKDMLCYYCYYFNIIDRDYKIISLTTTS